MLSLPRQLSAQIVRTRDQPDADNVHDLRVAIRRFNQALALRPQADGNRNLRRRLKKTMRLTGEVRNADITLKLISKLDRTRTLARRLHRRRGEAETRLTEALNQWPNDAFPPELPAQLSSTSAAVVHAAERLFKRARKASDPQHLHRLRIAAKKLRYMLEIVKPHDPRIDQIKQLQTELGDINDIETANAIVKEEGGGQRVRDELEKKQAKRIRAFWHSWRELFPDDKTQRKWIRDFSALHSRNVSRQKTVRSS
jgi:CHAD domain-containing protein